MEFYSQGEEFLKYAHNTYPGMTPQWFSRLSSYNLLLKIIPQNVPCLYIVDLACGDGFLLESIERMELPQANLIGLDISEGELALARTRLLGTNVVLKKENAQRTSLQDQSVDYVICHMALMLMDNIELVLQEIVRILRPGGVFSAVIGSGLGKGPLLDAFLKSLQYCLSHYQERKFASLGDKRVRSEEGVQSLFAAYPEFILPITIQNAAGEMKLALKEIIEFFMGSYEVACLSDEGREYLKSILAQEFAPFISEENDLTCVMNFRQITVMKKRN